MGSSIEFSFDLFPSLESGERRKLRNVLLVLDVFDLFFLPINLCVGSKESFIFLYGFINMFAERDSPSSSEIPEYKSKFDDNSSCTRSLDSILTQTYLIHVTHLVISIQS